MICLHLLCRACHNAPPHLNSRRLMQGFLYGRLCPGDNEYAHPLDLSPIVDLNQAKVVHIDMSEGEPQQVRACMGSACSVCTALQCMRALGMATALAALVQPSCDGLAVPYCRR